MLQNPMPKTARKTPRAYMEGVGNRIRWVREYANLGQTETAKLFGLNQAAWQKWEAGDRSPDPYILVAFCRRFHVTMDYIFRADVSGCHRALAAALLVQHPELSEELQYTAVNTDNNRL